MNVIAKRLGYREISRIADFIRKIENGNEIMKALQEHYSDITISYDIKKDEVVVYCSTMHYKVVYEEELILEGVLKDDII